MNSVFACIDIEQPFVAWAAYRGVFVSARAGHEYPNCPISVMMAGMLKYRNSTRLGNELAIERVRQKKFADKISRLTGMYFFESSAALEAASEWGAHFRKEYLAEFGLLPHSSLSRHDSNWITYAPRDRCGDLISVDWCDQYWLGKAFPKKEPIWEIIIDGRAVVFGTDLRNLAYANLKSLFPNCLAILEAGRIAAYLNSDLGQICAWLTQISETEFSLCHFLDMRDAKDNGFLNKLKDFKGPKNYNDLAVGGNKFHTPDFRDYGEIFKITDRFTKDFFVGIHGGN